jgi:hypothetical protein
MSAVAQMEGLTLRSWLTVHWLSWPARSPLTSSVDGSSASAH